MKKCETGWLRVLLSLAGILFSVCQARANLVVNGGFEAPGSGGAQQPPGWTFTKGFAGDGTSFTSTNAYGGNFAYLFNDATGGVDYQTGLPEQSDEISQVVATTPGEEYTLSFYAEEIQYQGIQGFWFVWNDSTGGPRFLAQNEGQYVQYTFTLTGGPGTSSTLGFEGFSVQAGYFLDNVDLEPAAVAAPEPAYFGVVGVALGCLFMRKRRRA